MTSRMFTPEPVLPGGSAASVPTPESTEFEYVLGRRQVASMSLVAFTALAIFTTAAYMVGKATVPPSPEPTKAPEPVKAKLLVVPSTTIAPQPSPELLAVTAPKTAPDAPIFGVADKKGLYIQLGSVERGFAVLMAHGARKVGYPAFVAPGSNPNVFRALVGPFNDKAEYETAKAMFISMGLDTFSRKHEEAAATPHDATMVAPAATPAETPQP